jgi:hypothetical protein
MSCGEIGAERFRAEVFEQGVGAGIPMNPLYRSKTARVMEAEFHARVETKGQMIVLSPRNRRGKDAQAAGHAEMNEQGAACGGKEQVFAPS